jgi:hypothetical protein
MAPSRPLKMLAVASTAAVGLLIAGVAGFYFLLGASCGNKVLAEVSSPNGAVKAVVFQRDCGATTGFSTQVSVVAAGSALGNSAGNVFVADSDHGSAPSGPGGGPEVKVQWRATDQLVVSHHPAARVFKAEPQARSIKVHYEPLAP